ncbi:hypothetical protein [uncultured Lutibacter sp.]|uniref:hypothetical protein n=1 Tax=uncultured Lutibacter sp. TaxID=437739 RepID=UPI00260AB537|nr:hypothetical protein [uncultured Lutibacter sp.]
MTQNSLPISNNNEKEQLLLKAQINLLEHELNVIEQKISSFEAILRSHLTNLLIEEQELTVLYKKLQKAKKEKRLAQKKKGKKFKEVAGLKVIIDKNKADNNTDQQKEKKRLYREAMLYVHPDKFSMNEGKIDIATEITTKLIEIYQTGSLEEIQNFHTHIFSGNALMEFMKPTSVTIDLTRKDIYLQKELEQLKIQLENVRTKHIYKVLTEYENPMIFIDELKEYYTDRIFKLKKRTRKANLFDL